jgi:murein DD-endopeptidase MepM/ murein hydrolase activator NlpD
MKIHSKHRLTAKSVQYFFSYTSQKIIPLISFYELLGGMGIFFLLVTLFSFVLFVSANSCYAASIKVPISQDTYVEQNFPTISPWNNKNIYIGNDYYYSKGKTRAFFKFEKTDLITNEILAQDIQDAFLYLYQYDKEDNSSYTTNVWSVKNDWHQYDINWTNQTALDTLISQTDHTPTDGWKTFEVSEVIKNELLNNTSKGFTMRLAQEDQGAGIFWSTACFSAPTPPICTISQIPYIKIRYIPNQAPSKPQLISPIDDTVTNIANQTFTAHTSKDPNSEDLKYKIQIADNNNFNSLVHESKWSSAPFFLYTFDNQGVFFWRVVVQDEHGPRTGRNISQNHKITIDTTPPATPMISPEPPFTDSTENTISWSSCSDNFDFPVRYQIQLSNDTFDTIAQTSDWIDKTNYTFSNLSDGVKYSYRIRSIDQAGNISPFSPIVSSTQDRLNPTIADFVLTERFISPDNPTSRGIKDYTEFHIKIKDQNLKRWILIIKDFNHRNISQYHSASQNLEVIKWPHSNIARKLDQGTYFAYIEAYDFTGKTNRSTLLTINIDNTTPKPPVIYSPSQHLITNTIPLLKIQFQKNYQSHVKYNSSVKRPDKNGLYEAPFANPNQGKNYFHLQSRDQAGNVITLTRHFIFDTIAPKKPLIALHAETDNRILQTEITGEKNTTAQIYVNNKLVKKGHMTREIIKTPVLTDWEPNRLYTVFVRLTDAAGNYSPKSSTETYKTPIKDVLGIGTGNENKIDYQNPFGIPTCNLEINKDTKSYSFSNCTNNSVKLAHVLNYGQLNKTYWVKTFGTVQDTIKLRITHKKCKRRTFFDPRTWFSCVEQTYKHSSKTISPRTYLYNVIDDAKLYSYRQKVNTKKHFKLTSYQFKENKNKTIWVKNNQITYFKLHGTWIDFNFMAKASNKRKVPKPIAKDPNAFGFVFGRHIGVTQWHGYTAYQSPHTGIDFGSYREPIISPAGGYIRTTGWDDYLGKCFSGGYYVRVEHDNGMNTVYLHLEHYKDKNGKQWKSGDRIAKGQQIGLSGNTGAWNCQPLGYHLHFELRKDRYQANHVNPVPYIKVDWSKIHTIDWQTYPGRLTGDNPHPSY